MKSLAVLGKACQSTDVVLMAMTIFSVLSFRYCHRFVDHAAAWSTDIYSCKFTNWLIAFYSKLTKHTTIFSFIFTTICILCYVMACVLSCLYYNKMMMMMMMMMMMYRQTCYNNIKYSGNSSSFGQISIV